MAFKLDFDTDNDAFAGDELIWETARILRDLADRLECKGHTSDKFQTVRDINGNDIGRWKLDTERITS